MPDISYAIRANDAISVLTLYSSGNAYLAGGLSQYSDASLTYNVEDVELNDCMNMLEHVNIKTYTRNDMEKGNQLIGFISQDVKQHLPEKLDNIISSHTITDKGTNSNRQLMTMAYARMVCVLSEFKH